MGSEMCICDRCRAPTWQMKRYVSSEQLGDDENMPLLGFPRCCKHLAYDLDPEVHAIATPPVLCWLCGAGFLSQQALYRHAREAHGDYAEYRKHLFWLAQKLGFLPLLLGRLKFLYSIHILSLAVGGLQKLLEQALLLLRLGLLGLLLRREPAVQAFELLRHGGVVLLRRGVREPLRLQQRLDVLSAGRGVVACCCRSPAALFWFVVRGSA